MATHIYDDKAWENIMGYVEENASEEDYNSFLDWAFKFGDSYANKGKIDYQYENFDPETWGNISRIIDANASDEEKAKYYDVISQTGYSGGYNDPLMLEYEKNKSYNAMRSALEEFAANSTPFQSQTPEQQAEYDSLLQEFLNKDFHYDPSADPTAEAIRREYITGGKLAMRDTLGTASAATGGLASSYAQQAGQQAYGSYMQNYATQVLPTLKEMAEAQHQRETNEILSKLGILGTEIQNDYTRQYNEWKANEAARSQALENELAILGIEGDRIDSELEKYYSEQKALAEEEKALDAKIQESFKDLGEKYENALTEEEKSAVYEAIIALRVAYGIEPEQLQRVMADVHIPYNLYREYFINRRTGSQTGSSADNPATTPKQWWEDAPVTGRYI